MSDGGMADLEPACDLSIRHALLVQLKGLLAQLGRIAALLAVPNVSALAKGALIALYPLAHPRLDLTTCLSAIQAGCRDISWCRHWHIQISVPEKRHIHSDCHIGSFTLSNVQLYVHTPMHATDREESSNLFPPGRLVLFLTSAGRF